MVRLQHLYAYGYEPYAIAGILREEFQDIEVNDVNSGLIAKIIKQNLENLEDYKKKFASMCEELQMDQSKDLFTKAGIKDNKIASKLMDKVDGLLGELELIDLKEVDDKGRPVGLAMYEKLLDMIEKTQKLYGKIAGSDAYREYKLFEMKAKLQASLKPNGAGLLVPPSTSPSGDVIPEVTG